MQLDSLANWAQIISLPVALVAIVTSIWFYRRGKRIKAFSCFFEPPIYQLDLSGQRMPLGGLQILYEGRPVDNIFVLRAKLANTGNEPIRKSEIIVPITFEIPSAVKLLKEPAIIETIPRGLPIRIDDIKLRQDAYIETFTISAELLNPGDTFVVEFVCSGNLSNPNVNCRIEGVRSIDFRDVEFALLKRNFVGGVSSVAIVMMFTAIVVIVSFILSYLEIKTHIPISKYMGWLLIPFLVFLPFLFVYIFFNEFIVPLKRIYLPKKQK